MSLRNGFAGAALCACLACSSMALADQPAPQLSIDQPAMLAAGAGRRPLMSALDSAGIAKPLEDAGINIYGHIEAGYTYNFDQPDSKLNPYRIFDFQHNKVLLDQIDLTTERLVDYRKGKFDVGFRMEWLWGADAGLIHSNGLFDYYDGVRKPENQFDLPQLYIDIAIPVGTGLRIRAGKFENFVGYETINPTTGGIVDFYSRSFIFFNYPFTHTGIIGTYDIVKDVTLTAGITRGDNQSTRDNNDGISFLASVNCVISKELALYLSNSTGPEQDDNTRDYRTTFDLTLFYTPSPKLQLAGNAYYVRDSHAGDSGQTGQLLALAALGAYTINDYVIAKARIEWAHDDTGFRLGPVNNLYEITLGATVRPFPTDNLGKNVKLRPEIRYDWSNEDAFNGKGHQVTAAIDAVITF